MSIVLVCDYIITLQGEDDQLSDFETSSSHLCRLCTLQCTSWNCCAERAFYAYFTVHITQSSLSSSSSSHRSHCIAEHSNSAQWQLQLSSSRIRRRRRNKDDAIKKSDSQFPSFQLICWTKNLISRNSLQYPFNKKQTSISSSCKAQFKCLKLKSEQRKKMTTFY